MRVETFISQFSKNGSLPNEFLSEFLNEFLNETCCDYVAATVQALVRGMKFKNYRDLFHKDENGEIRLYSRVALGLSALPQAYERLKVSPVTFHLNMHLDSGKSLFHTFVVFGNAIMDAYIHIRKVEVREFDFELFDKFVNHPSVEVWNRLFKVNFRGRVESLRIKVKW